MGEIERRCLGSARGSRDSGCGMIEEWLQTTFHDELLNKRGRRDSGVDVDMEDEVLIS